MATNSSPWLKKEGLRVGHLNINHIINKLTEVSLILANSGKSFHVFGFSEAHLPSGVSKKDLSIPGYIPIRNKPKHDLETGLLMYIHQSVRFTRIKSLEQHNVETLWIEFHMKHSKPVLLCFLYRNPAERVDWIDRFIFMMDNAYNRCRDIIILGDFNIDLLKGNSHWNLTFKSYGLSQLIQSPTRVAKGSKTLIDHLYATDPKTIIETFVPISGCSDHFPTCFTWSKKGVKIPKLNHKTIILRNFSKFDNDKFISDLLNSRLDNVYQYTNPDQALDVWYNIFYEVYNKHAPLQTKRVKYQIKPPWLTDEIQKEIYYRDYLLKHGSREDFKKQRNKVTSFIRAEKKKYFLDLINNKKDGKTVWKAIHRLTNKHANCATTTSDISADNLNYHFTSVAKQVIKDDNSENNNLSELRKFCQEKNIHCVVDVRPLCVYEVFTALRQLKQTGTRGIDGIDGKILKLSAPVIAETLTYIYNLCLDKCYFPKIFKQAKIIPLFKSGTTSDPSNYRPISILSVLSKPLEQHIYKCLTSHLNKYDLIHPNQSGFREFHSCHTALTKLIDRWLVNVNKRQFTGVLFVDFAKAFDVIDHKLLLKKLAVYKLSPNTLELISSFLSNRQQKVSLNASISDFLPNNFGVPQGSVLGPLLFSLYINDLPLFIGTQCDMFADDTTLETTNLDAHKVYHSMQQSIHDLVKWTHLNHMALHPHKTKFMLVTTRQKRQNLTKTLPILYIDKVEVEEVVSHKVLGITIDNNLSWSKHLENISRNIASKLYQFRKIKNFLDLHARKLFFYSYIQSTIDYASTLWDLASNKVLKPLFSIHKRAVKITINKSSSLTATDYKHANILPFHAKLVFNKGILMHKILYGNAPSSLINMFTFNNYRHSHKLNLPFTTIILCKSSLTYSGGWLWNHIPKSLKSESSLKVFKSSFHNYLMTLPDVIFLHPKMY